MNAPGRIEMLEESTDVLTLEPQPTDAPRALTVQTPQSPMAMMVQAQANGTSLETLERMWALQVKFEAANAEKAYNAAFAAFKAEAVKIIKNRSVADGPLKGKRYAELHAVVNAATPALSRHGLSASWKLTKDDKDWLEVTCTLKHVGGHTESVFMGGPPDSGGAKNAIQARASTVSYLERYTFKAITGLSEQDDDDNGGGNGDQSADALLKSFRDASMNGTAALRAHYEKSPPSDEWWSKHAKSLKDAAKVADTQHADGGAK